MKQIFIFTLLSISCFVGCPDSIQAKRKQGKVRLDSLLLAANAISKDDTNNVNILNAISAEIKINDPDTAIHFATLALAMAEKMKFSKGTINAYNNIGNGYYRHDNYPLALKNYFAALKISDGIGDKVSMANTYANIGVIRFYQGDYTEMLKNCKASLSIWEELGDKKGIGSCYFTFGIVYENQGKYADAIKSYLMVVKLDDEANDKNGAATSYNRIGNVYAAQGDYPQALNYFLAALKIREESKDKDGIARSYSDIGRIYDAQNNFPEALKQFVAALNIQKEIGDKQGIANSYNDIAQLYDSQNKYADALKNFLASLQISEEIGNRYFIVNLYNSIGNLYRHQGDTARSLENYFHSIRIAKEIGDKQGISTAYNSIGGIYEIEGNYPEAFKNYRAALTITKELGAKADLASSRIAIGCILIKLKDFWKAEKYIDSGLLLAKEIKNMELIAIGYGSRSTLDSIKGDWRGAYRNRILYDVYRDSVTNKENIKKMVQSQMQYDFDMKEAASKAEQNKKDALIKEQLKREKNIKYVSFAGAALLLVIAVTSVGAYRQKQRDNRIITKEKQRSDELLLNILPLEVAEELKNKGSSEAKHFDNVTVLFTDFMGFTHLSERLSPKQLVSELDNCFKAFDGIMGKYAIEKIKTVGDAYLAVSGLPAARPRHAEDVVNAAIEIRDFMLQRKKQVGDMTFDIRIGVHSGNVVAGIVGVKKFAYDIWGDTVNTAARMEQNSEAGKINISESTYALVKDKFDCIYRGKIAAKNKGELSMYFVSSASGLST